MKKVTVIIIIIGILALIYILKRDSSPANNNNNTPTASESGTFRPDPSNATFIFSDGPVALSLGRSEKSIAPESAFVEEIILLDKFAYGDINTDGKEDTAVLLARYGGGSGIFIYVAAFVSGPVNYKGSKVIFIGDRIAPQAISINGRVVTVEYLDREPDEAFAAEPTVPTSKQFVYEAGELREK
ncbi:MAG: hypothetical protein HYT68_01550 [Candidatus Zambryskibacteria bacterium]|nr:hypothetical protein [Candidatus Zambryskibacteria bacterium]